MKLLKHIYFLLFLSLNASKLEKVPFQSSHIYQINYSKVKLILSIFQSLPLVLLGFYMLKDILKKYPIIKGYIYE